MSDPAVGNLLRKKALESSKAAEIAQHIPSILQNPKEARDRLLTLIRDPSSQRLYFIVWGFSRLSEKGNEEEFLDACLDHLRRGNVGNFKDMFGQSLIWTFRNHKQIRDFALEELESSDPPLSTIAEAFALDEEIRHKVGELITPLNTGLRLHLVSELPACGDPNFALELLWHWDCESNAEVKALACVNYNALLLETNKDTQPSLQQLTVMIPCYGIHHEQRRQAALAGLLTLRAADGVRGKTETIGFVGRPVVVELSTGLETNRVLAESIGKNWEYLKETFEGDPSQFLQRPGRQDFWDELA